MADYDDLNTKRIFMVGILSIVVTAVTALAVQVVYYALVSWHDAELSEKSSYRRQNAVWPNKLLKSRIMGSIRTPEPSQFQCQKPWS